MAIACYSYEPRHVPGFFIWYAFYDFSRATSLASAPLCREWSDRGYLHANRSLPSPSWWKLCMRNGRPCWGCEIDRPISFHRSEEPIAAAPFPRHFLHLRRPSIRSASRTLVYRSRSEATWTRDRYREPMLSHKRWPIEGEKEGRIVVAAKLNLLKAIRYR